MCGAFNTNLIQSGAGLPERKHRQKIELLAVGRKRARLFPAPHGNGREYIGLSGKGRIDFAEALEVARDVVKRFPKTKRSTRSS